MALCIVIGVGFLIAIAVVLTVLLFKWFDGNDDGYREPGDWPGKYGP